MRSFDDCRVRDIDAGDLARVLAWRNDPDVRRYMLTQSVITAEEHMQWFERALKDPKKSLLIVEERDLPLGCVNFSNVEVGGTVDWGFYAVPNAAKGAGTKVGVAALDYAFGVLEVSRVCGQSMAENEASILLHRRLGFRQETVLRDQRKIGEICHDLIYFGLRRHEWHIKRAELDLDGPRKNDT